MLEALVVIPPASAVTPWRKPRQGAQRRALRGETMGTTWHVQWFDEVDQPHTRFSGALQHELDIVIEQMSHWLPTSHLSRLRSVPSGQWTTIPTEFCKVLDYALQVAQQTGGAYDPTVADLVSHWGFGPGISSNQSTHGWRNVELDTTQSRVRHAGGLALDFSAIAKGFAVDQLARMLQRSGIDHFLVEIGGELRASGLKDSRQPWWVELEPPGDVPFPSIRVALSGWSLATSGDYRQSHTDGIETWSHTIDPRTGRPVTNAVTAVTVLHQECMAADAYSTALLVLGLQDGLDFADKQGLAALMVERQPTGLGLHVSAAWRALL